MPFKVVFAPEAEAQLAALYEYIEAHASADIAARYTGAILTYCESLAPFPHRGIKRDDIRPGLRITNFRGSASIAFFVSGDLISIAGVFYGGQDLDTALKID